LLYAYVAGALGAQMNILFKGAAELVAGTISGQVTSFRDDTLRSLLWIAATIALAVMQISYINQGLQRFDCVLFSPLYSAWLMVCGVTWGGTYYQEFRCFDALDWSMFLLGLAITLAGIATLLWDKTHLRDIKRISGEQQDQFDYPAAACGTPARDDASVGTLEAYYATSLAESGAEPLSPDDRVALARA
jgi:hypothetical protein